MRLFRHDVVESTNELAFAELAAGRALHGDVHVARSQTRGRGRLGRAWHSASGEGLYTSIVLVPGPPPWNAAAATMAFGLATLDAVRALGLDTANLKWPNDVCVDGAKLAGVLVETRGFDPDAPAYVAGIGINVAQRSFPAELLAERAVTSLVLQGIDCGVERALAALQAAWPARVASIRDDPRTLCDDFAVATGLLGWLVHVESGELVVEGDLLEISIERGLVLRTPASEEVAIALEVVRSVTPA